MIRADASSLAAWSLWQGVLSPAGPHAERIERLTWLLLGLGAVIWIAVVALALYALAGRRPPRSPFAPWRAVRAGVAFTIVVLFGLTAASYVTGRDLDRLVPHDRPPLTVELIGHQWWWEIRYADSLPARTLTTANELHIPVGQPVLIKLTSRDVIHSFWVPALHGKWDQVPGYTNAVVIQADTPGVYRGQCAEYCGHQHANMRITVVAQPPDSFARWYEAQLAPAAPPAAAAARRGRDVFLGSACALCHTIRGTPAAATIGPELTHLASRREIAAGTLPNTVAYLTAWVLNPQHFKPGARMPPQALSGGDARALVAYLQSLR